MDASAILRALIQDEPGSLEAQTLLRDLMVGGAEVIAPDVFLYEVGNNLRKLAASNEARLATLERAAGIVRSIRPSADARRATLELATQHGVSYYDASYVVTAREEGAALWTEDRELLRKFPDVAEDTATLRTRTSR